MKAKQKKKTTRQQLTTKTIDVNDLQYGGSHYKLFNIQPWDAIDDWQLGYLDGSVVKYLCRWKYKNGIEDLEKAKHFLEKLIEKEQEREDALNNYKNTITNQ